MVNILVQAEKALERKSMIFFLSSKKNSIGKIALKLFLFFNQSKQVQKLCLGMLLVAGFSLLLTKDAYGQGQQPITIKKKNAQGIVVQQKVISEDQTYLNLFRSIYSVLRNRYVDESKVDPDDLIFAAIKGMLKSLDDPYTVFFDSETFKKFKQQTDSIYKGIGVYLVKEGKKVKVSRVIENSPAWEVGIEKGDSIIAVNGQVIKDYSFEEVIRSLSGEEGTIVELKIDRQGKNLEYSIQRGEILVKSVYAALITEDDSFRRINNDFFLEKAINSEFIDNETEPSFPVGYMRVLRFAAKTHIEFQKTLNLFKKEHVSGIIIDLRSNPGGFLHVAVSMVDSLISSGTIVSTRSRGNREKIQKASARLDFPKFLPVLILVNSSSASASEVFTGALRDHERAVTLGEKTFGKFSVQQQVSFNLKEPVALKLSIAGYYLPNGQSYHKKGIPVDIEVKNDEGFKLKSVEASLQDADKQLHEALRVIRSPKLYQKYSDASVEEKLEPNPEIKN